MDEKQVLFGLHELPGIGWKTIFTLKELLGDLRELLDMKESIREGLPLEPHRIDALAPLSEDWIEQRLQAYEERNVHIVTRWDDHYPSLLAESFEPPWVLYGKGDLRLLERASLAMVGTRAMTPYGRRAAHLIAGGLSESGVTVVSGLAQGIDATAHRAALEGPGSTIAVMGTSFDEVYPREHGPLCRDIVHKGLVLTEVALGTKSHPGLFPRRNRIIAGLTLGTIVVEASSRSGSLITADMAMEASRDVFAVPGPITSKQSEGTLELIRQGAIPIGGAADALREYPRLQSFQAEEPSHNESVTATPAEQDILAALEHDPLTVDQIHAVTRLEFGHLHAVLLSLLIKKKIKQLPGSVYMLWN